MSKKNKIRRAISVEGPELKLELELSSFCTPKVDKEFFYLDKKSDGTWSLAFNIDGISMPEIDLLRIIRED
jgi:hypothetical protein